MHKHIVVWSYDGIVYSNENTLQSHIITWTNTTNNTGSQKQVPIGHIQYDTFIQSSKPGKTKLTCFREADIGDELSKGTDTIKVRVMMTSESREGLIAREVFIRGLAGATGDVLFLYLSRGKWVFTFQLFMTLCFCFIITKAKS